MGVDEMLKGYNMDNFMEYCHQFNFAENNKFCDDADYILRFWREAKGEYLYDLMGQELTLSKRFTYERDNNELLDSLEEMVNHHHWFYNRFHDQLRTALGANPHNWDYSWPNEDNRNFFYAVRNWGAPDSLMDNRVETKAQATINGKLIKINAGEKIMRALRKICVALRDAGYEDLTDDLEDLRLDHSRVFNQKTLTGELCLSIHPLDYATASDNDNGWSSCMSWQEEGCYRLGTVEMMNSPMVICAYLKSDVQQMEFGGYTWPSKKWRAWIIVNKDAILCNRNYPYTNDNLAKECISWVAELAKENLGWEFNDKVKPVYDWKHNNVELEYGTNFMYNDFRDDMWSTINVNITEGYHYINYSGVANCMNCGDEIPWEGDQDSSTLCCYSCRDMRFCDECGDSVRDSDEYYYGPNGELLCPDCYSRLVTHCELCDTDIYIDDSVSICVPINRSLYTELTNNSQWTAPYCSQNICPDCARNIGITADTMLDGDDISFPNNWWHTENNLDPRKVPITTFYLLLGYKLDANNEPVYEWARKEIKNLHIDELWEDYRRYVVDTLGEID